MSPSNAEGDKPKVRIELASVEASASEAAAIVAAVEQFIADTTPPPAPRPAVSAGQRAALADNVSGRQFEGGYVWGHAPRPWH